MSDDIKSYIALLEQAMGGVTLYHGSNNNIDKFNLDFVSSGTGNDEHGIGIYLTNDKDVASRYGIYTYAVELSPDVNEVPDKPPSPAIAKKLLKQAPNLKDTLTDWAENSTEAFNTAVEAMCDVDTMAEMLDQIWYDFYRDSPKKFLINMVVTTGFDYKIVDVDDGLKYIVLFNPTKISSTKLVDED